MGRKMYDARLSLVHIMRVVDETQCSQSRGDKPEARYAKHLYRSAIIGEHHYYAIGTLLDIFQRPACRYDGDLGDDRVRGNQQRTATATWVTFRILHGREPNTDVSPLRNPSLLSPITQNK